MYSVAVLPIISHRESKAANEMNLSNTAKVNRNVLLPYV